MRSVILISTTRKGNKMQELTTTELQENIQLLKGYVSKALESGEYENAEIYIKSIQQFSNQLIETTIKELLS